jgi:preprotein translocase subunit SecG
MVNHAMALVALVLVYAVLLVMLIVIQAGRTQGIGLGLGDGKKTGEGLGDGLGDVTAGEGDGVGGAAMLYTATHVTAVAGCNSSTALPTLLSLLGASGSSDANMSPNTRMLLLLRRC